MSGHVRGYQLGVVPSAHAAKTPCISETPSRSASALAQTSCPREGLPEMKALNKAYKICVLYVYIYIYTSVNVYIHINIHRLSEIPCSGNRHLREKKHFRGPHRRTFAGLFSEHSSQNQCTKYTFAAQARKLQPFSFKVAREARFRSSSSQALRQAAHERTRWPHVRKLAGRSVDFCETFADLTPNIRENPAGQLHST